MISEPETDKNAERRPLTVRNAAWARSLAAWLSQRSITPNQISVLSVVFAVIGAGALFSIDMSAKSLTPSWLLLAAAFCMQARLLCNLLDGMVAIEGGKSTPTGGLYNEVPDRIADSLFLVAAGYAAQWIWLGWLAALLAMMTAYIRTLVASLGLPHDFSGPMAKQQRMAVLSLACLMAGVEYWQFQSVYSIQLALVIIALGSAYTCVRRLWRAANKLQPNP